MQFLQAYKVVLAQTEIKLNVSSGRPTCRTPPSSHQSMLITVTCRVFAAEAVKHDSEEPQSLFLLLHCSALLSLALTSCILVQVVESWLWVPAGLGAVPNVGQSQQSISACVKISCRSRETSLCPSALLTCDFIMIRKENWDALNPILILFRHLNRVCIIWFMRMDFCLEGKEEYVCVCECLCLCVGTVGGFVWFLLLYKNCLRVALLWIERPFSASVTQSLHLSLFLSAERWR